LGISPESAVSTKNQRGKKGRRKGGAGVAGGEENWRPPVGEPDAVAPLDQLVAAWPAGEAA
jgi:hypothetical protein